MTFSHALPQAVSLLVERGELQLPSMDHPAAAGLDPSAGAYASPYGGADADTGYGAGYPASPQRAPLAPPPAGPFGGPAEAPFDGFGWGAAEQQQHLQLQQQEEQRLAFERHGNGNGGGYGAASWQDEASNVANGGMASFGEWAAQSRPLFGGQPTPMSTRSSLDSTVTSSAAAAALGSPLRGAASGAFGGQHDSLFGGGKAPLAPPPLSLPQAAQQPAAQQGNWGYGGAFGSEQPTGQASRLAAPPGGFGTYGSGDYGRANGGSLLGGSLFGAPAAPPAGPVRYGPPAGINYGPPGGFGSVFGSYAAPLPSAQESRLFSGAWGLRREDDNAGASSAADDLDLDAMIGTLTAS